MLITDAILLGGGAGKRFSTSTETPSEGLPKQFRMLGNAPVFIHCLRSILEMDSFRQVIFVVGEPHLALAQEQIDSYLTPAPKIPIRIISGGERRQDSSRLALEAIEATPPIATRVLIHDACRPYLSKDFCRRILEALGDRSYGAWVPIVPVVETLKRVKNHQVVETVDRAAVQRVQTPQVFEYTVIRSLVQKTRDREDLNFTDDASLCEYYGIPVGVFEGDVRNIKLTYSFEMQTLSTMLQETRPPSCEPGSATTFTV
jgi:2-C-methyl-D-erythritol 4-phosphate cytidylyltransferase